MTCLVLPNAFCRGRHASKVTEEEEDAEYLKEEEDGLSGSGSTRLVAQPSCKMIFPHFVKCLVILLVNCWSLWTVSILVTVW